MKPANSNPNARQPPGANQAQAAATTASAVPFRELDDDEWQLIASLHPAAAAPPHRGRPRAAPRAMVNAALWILWSGSGWLTLPPRYPSPSTCRRHFERWLADGTWHAMAQCLAGSGRLTHCSRSCAPRGAATGLAPVRATFCSVLMG